MIWIASFCLSRASATTWTIQAIITFIKLMQKLSLPWGKWSKNEACLQIPRDDIFFLGTTTFHLWRIIIAQLPFDYLNIRTATYWRTSPKTCTSIIRHFNIFLLFLRIRVRQNGHWDMDLLCGDVFISWLLLKNHTNVFKTIQIPSTLLF